MCKGEIYESCVTCRASRTTLERCLSRQWMMSSRERSSKLQLLTPDRSSFSIYNNATSTNTPHSSSTIPTEREERQRV